jgi:hypothetical protein
LQVTSLRSLDEAKRHPGESNPDFASAPSGLQLPREF